MESTEENPPPSDAPAAEQPAAEGSSEAPAPEASENPEGEKPQEPAPAPEEGHEGGGDSAAPEVEKPEETASEVQEGKAEGGEEGLEAVGDSAEGKPGEEPVEVVEEPFTQVIDENVSEQVPLMPFKGPEDAEEPERTDEEFVGDVMESIVAKVVDMATIGQYLYGIVKKIVAHVTGEESSEEEEPEESEVFEEPFMEEPVQDAEDVSTEVLKYLLGPESLKLEEERWEPEFPPTCIAFLNVVEFAKRFVDDILETAKDVCYGKYGIPVKYQKKQVEVQNIRWPSIENFSVELGSKKIDEYVQMTFEVEENWLYKINFIAAQSDLSSDVYLYEVVFCIPTPCYPIAQATVSLYFCCDVSRVKPRECPIDVTYSIESLKEILVPGKTVVNDDMLLRLVYSKLSVFKSLYF